LNPRIQKITEDIAKLKRKITSNQARLRELERLKVELENADIVAAVRSIDVAPEALAALIQKLQLTPQEPKAIGTAEGVPVVQSQAVPDLEAEEACFEENTD
jgi:hypothetical protein